MKATHGLEFRRPCLTVAGCLVVGVFLMGFATAQEATSTNTVADQQSATAKPAAPSDNSDSSTDYNNWITLGVGGTFIDGDKGAFMQQQQTHKDAFGGIESFHWEEKVGKKGLFQIDGRGIFNNHDYSVRLELSEPDKGYVRAGYTEFRMWYDGSGGFFPANNLWFSPYSGELAVDRGDAWFEAGLTLPGKPVITFRYDHQFRRGEKDSTSWGDATVTGVSGTSRNIVPTFRTLDETRDIFQGDIKHTVGKTDLGLGLRYEIDSNNDSINISRAPNNPAQSRFVTEKTGLDEDLFNVHAFTETRFNEKARLTLGGSFTTLDTDISGSRIYGSSYDSDFVAGYLHSRNHDEGFLALSGGANTKQYVANLNLMVTPYDNFTIVPAIRIEREDTDASANYTDTSVSANNAPAVSTPAFGSNDEWFLEVAESLEARYTGIRNLSLYARGEWSEDNGNFNYNQTGPTTVMDNTDWNRFVQKYLVGANWYPLSRLNFGVQYYHKIHKYDYDVIDSNNAYDDMTGENFTTDDMNIRATWRPASTLTLVTRYDFQLTTVHVGMEGLNTQQTAETTTHIISESVSWTPLPRLYLQANGSYVLSGLDTLAASALGSTNLVPNLANDYWNASAMIGYLLDDKTDLQLQYYYYRANNFVNNSAYGQPYGASDEEQSVTATITRKISKALRVSLKYGFFKNRDETSGGHNNYQAHLIYSSLQYYF